MREKEPVSGPGVLLSLERGNGPLHEQLELNLREQVRSGRLAAGTRMPSSRALAAELGISRGVVLEAYGQLAAEGYLVASQGAPTRVASGSGSEPAPLAAGSLEPRYAYRFDPTLPDLASFLRGGWLRSLRSALREAPFDAFGHGDPRGAPDLRNALMTYLARARGAAPEPEHTPSARRRPRRCPGRPLARVRKRVGACDRTWGRGAGACDLLARAHS